MVWRQKRATQAAAGQLNSLSRIFCSNSGEVRESGFVAEQARLRMAPRLPEEGGAKPPIQPTRESGNKWSAEGAIPTRRIPARLNDRRVDPRKTA